MADEYSVKTNVVWNMSAQLFVAVIGVLVLPLYLKYLGSESYGLIMFYTNLVVWFSVLDLGITPSVSRITSLYLNKAIAFIEYQNVFNSFLVFIIAIALLSMTVGFFSIDWVAVKWLKVDALDYSVVYDVIFYTFAVIIIRWSTGIFRGILTGAEKIVWLSQFSISISFARFIIPLPFIVYWGWNVVDYFKFQFFLAITEFCVIAFKSKPFLPHFEFSSVALKSKSVTEMVRFSAAIATTTVIWLFVTQIDKVIISAKIPIDQYGYFSTTVLVANFILLLSSTCSSVLMPRFCALHAQGNYLAVRALYLQSTSFIAAGSLFILTVSTYLPFELLYIWSSDVEFSKYGADLLFYYAMGNFLLAMNGFPYYLQYAAGKLRLHLISHVFMLITIVPLVLFFVSAYGVFGAAIVWLAFHSLYFLFWVPLLHKLFLPGIQYQWSMTTISIPCIFVMAVTGLLVHTLKSLGVEDSLYLVTVTIIVTFICIAFVFKSIRDFLITSMKMVLR